jgi:signal transduction histidine kinase
MARARRASKPTQRRPPAAGARRAAPAADHRLAILYAIAEAVTRHLTLDDALPTALDALVRVTGHEISSLHLLSHDRRMLHLVAERGMSRELRDLNRRLPVGQGLLGTVAATGTLLRLGDVRRSPALLTEVRSVVTRDRLRSLLCAPIVSRGHVLGTLTLGRRTTRAFSDHDVTLVQAAADRIGLALDNARLAADSSRHLEELKVAEAQIIHSDRLSAVGRLAAGVAHEVRSPLTAILGHAHLLLMDVTLAESSRQRVNVIVEETSRAVRILQRVLTFSRQDPPERRPAALADLVGRVLELTAYELTRRNIEVDTDFEPCPPVWVDTSQIQQVLLNLVQNAWQAMAAHAGRGRLTLRLRPLDHGARLELLDSGPGIRPEALPRVFDAFYTTKPPAEGTGLGLWIAYNIVEQHGGRLWAETRPEGGAAFIVELRNRRPGPPARPEPAAEGVAAG